MMSIVESFFYKWLTVYIRQLPFSETELDLLLVPGFELLKIALDQCLMIFTGFNRLYN